VEHPHAVHRETLVAFEGLLRDLQAMVQGQRQGLPVGREKHRLALRVLQNLRDEGTRVVHVLDGIGAVHHVPLRVGRQVFDPCVHKVHQWKAHLDEVASRVHDVQHIHLQLRPQKVRPVHLRQQAGRGAEGRPNIQEANRPHPGVAREQGLQRGVGIQQEAQGLRVVVLQGVRAHARILIGQGHLQSLNEPAQLPRRQAPAQGVAHPLQQAAGPCGTG